VTANTAKSIMERQAAALECLPRNPLTLTSHHHFYAPEKRPLIRMRSFFALIAATSITIALTGCGSSPSATSNVQPAPAAPGATSGPSGGSGGSDSSSFVSFVYTAGANNITAYGVNADGSLVAALGSPYASPTETHIVTNGANVYTVDADRMTLKVYSVNQANGALTLANTANAITGNTNPADLVDYLSMDHTGTSLYIGQFDSSGDDGVALWNVGSSPNATFAQWDGDSEVFGPPLVWSPDNVYAYSGNCYHADWTVFMYVRASNGTLTPPNLQTGAAPPSTTQPCPIAFAVSAKGFLAIASTATPQGGTIGVSTYMIHGDGSLSLVSTLATASNGGPTGGAPVGINFDPTGTYLTAAGNGGVQTFAVSSTGTLTPVASPQNAGVQFENVAWDSSHVFATTSTQLYVWNANNGQLSAATGSPVAGGAGVTVLPKQ
jgi:6-phosphogluconolactonase (cycloisomerase 2 family)